MNIMEQLKELINKVERLEKSENNSLHIIAKLRNQIISYENAMRDAIHFCKVCDPLKASNRLENILRNYDQPINEDEMVDQEITKIKDIRSALNLALEHFPEPLKEHAADMYLENLYDAPDDCISDALCSALSIEEKKQLLAHFEGGEG